MKVCLDRGSYLTSLQGDNFQDLQSEVWSSAVSMGRIPLLTAERRGCSQGSSEFLDEDLGCIAVQE